MGIVCDDYQVYVDYLLYSFVTFCICLWVSCILSIEVLCVASECTWVLCAVRLEVCTNYLSYTYVGIVNLECRVSVHIM